MATKRLSPFDLQKNELQNAVVHKLGTAPGSPVSGQIYYDTGTNILYFYNGSSWISTQATAVSYGSPAASAVGDTAADGVAATVARSDHRHAREGFGAVTAQTAFGASSGNGAATTLARSDHTHGTPAAPTASSVGAVTNAGNAGSLQTGTAAARPSSGQTAGNIYVDNDDFLAFIATSATTFAQIAPFAAAGAVSAISITGAQGAGTASTYARGDHAHAGPGFGAVTVETSYGGAAANGSAATVARSDHTHGTPSLTSNAASTQAFGDAAAVGTGTAPARDDHKHAMPALGNVTAQTAYGAASANGSATTASRSDHTHGTPTHVAADHSAISRSAFAAPTADVAWGGFKITGLADPTSAQDAATKAYVDATAVGIEVKPSVRAATTGALPNTPTYANGTSGVGATLTAGSNAALPTIDGVTLSVNDRLLVKDQATQAQNGIYVVTAVGSGAAPWVLTRATDSDTTGEVSAGNITYVESGTINGAQQWIQTTTGAITMGTTAIAWTQFSGASATTAGAGLTATGNVFAVGAGTGISVAADSVAIDTAVVVRKYAASIGDGVATSFVLTHNLGTQDITVAVYTNSGAFDEVGVDVEHTSTNTCTLRFSAAPASNAYRVVVHG